MFENRAKGIQLVKRVSYVYLFFAVLLAAATVFLEGYDFSLSAAFFIVLGIILYVISAKFSKSRYAWILIAVCAAATIIKTLSLLGLCLAILLIVAAKDIKKERDE